MIHIKHIDHLDRPCKSCNWVYFGSDFTIFRLWEDKLGRSQNIRIGDLLQEVAEKLRTPFLDWLEEQGQGRGLSWWVSRVSEANTYFPGLFLHICYLDVLWRIYSENDLLIVLESRALAAQIEKECRSREVKVESSVRERPVRFWLRFALFWCRTFAKWYVNSKYLRLFYQSPEISDGCILLHSCISDGYFSQTADKIRDRYFGNLACLLSAETNDVVVVPWQNDCKTSLKSRLQWFSQSTIPHLLPERFYGIVDYGWSLVQIFKTATQTLGHPTFQGRDLSAIAAEDFRLGTLDANVLRFVLYYRLIGKLSRDVSPRVWIDIFENMITEKPQLLALKTFMPETLTVGYAHLLVPAPMLLCTYAHSNDVCPQRIVCSSEWFAEMLVSEGFDPKKVHPGPSLRFSNLREARLDRQPGERVIVVLPLEASAAQELCYKVSEAFEKVSDLRIILKPHPLMSTKVLDSILPPNMLPDQANLANQALGDLLDDALCVVVTASSAAVEMALNAIPVIVIGRETSLDMNPLAWFESLPPLVRTPECIRNRVSSIRRTDRSLWVAWANEHQDRLVGGEANNLQLFLP